MSRPALVLDIDETSLSNQAEMEADGFGHFNDGNCDAPPRGPCGFDAWARLRQAARGRRVLRHRRHADMTLVTAVNLRRMGCGHWDGLFLEPQGSHFASAAHFKARTRAAIERCCHTVLASVGEQRSGLDGGHAERGYLLPNPFCFIP